MKHILAGLLVCSSQFFFYARAQGESFETEIDSLISEYVDRDQFNGSILLALVVERVCGQPFEQFVLQKLFKEVGMDHSFVRSRNLSANSEDLVKSYNHGKQADWPLYRVGPGGIYSTLEDLFLWDQAFFTYKIFDQSTVNRILTPVQVAGKDQHYGLGWGILHLEGKSFAGHTGGMFGFRTLYEHQIQENNTLILLTNIGDLTPLMEIRNKLAAAMSRQRH